MAILSVSAGVLRQYRPGVAGTAYGGIGPTQQLVDAYAMNTGRYPIAGYSVTGKPIVDEEAGYNLENELVKTDWEYPAKGWSTSDNYWIKAPNCIKTENRVSISRFSLAEIPGCTVKPKLLSLLLKVAMVIRRTIIRRADICVIASMIIIRILPVTTGEILLSQYSVWERFI